jgi:hypothetical protein
MKTKILAGLLLAGSTMFAAPRVSFGIGIGVPAPVVVERPIVAAVPPCPRSGLRVRERLLATEPRLARRLLSRAGAFRSF